MFRSLLAPAVEMVVRSISSLLVHRWHLLFPFSYFYQSVRGLIFSTYFPATAILSFHYDFCVTFIGAIFVVGSLLSLYISPRVPVGWWNHESAPFKFSQDYMEIMGGTKSDKWERQAPPPPPYWCFLHHS